MQLSKDFFGAVYAEQRSKGTLYSGGALEASTFTAINTRDDGVGLSNITLVS